MLSQRRLIYNVLMTVICFTLAFPLFLSAQSAMNTNRKVIGLLENDLITEASGLAASRQNVNVLWVHNDSGDEARIFAMTTEGKNLGIYTIEGATAIDWEDIAVGPGPLEECDYIYIADIGDNKAERSIKHIYRVVEPEVYASRAPKDTVLTQVEQISFRYPDGKYDAEALMVDPITRDIYVITKREQHVRLYRLVFPQEVKKTNEAEFITELNLTDVTAADISATGGEILVKTYNMVYYWNRIPGRKLTDVLKKDTPQNLPYVPEPQGEAIAWHPNSLGFYTTSEEKGGMEAQLIFYKF
ncbi:hypothetical protein JW960_22595 [candidate division KSB1 bacterium]|nr:hypothetical protein [candidate division KSB1 bacterium]